MLLKVDCLPNAVGKQLSIPLIYLGRKWMFNWWWWYDILSTGACHLRISQGKRLCRFLFILFPGELSCVDGIQSCLVPGTWYLSTRTSAGGSASRQLSPPSQCLGQTKCLVFDWPWHSKGASLCFTLFLFMAQVYVWPETDKNRDGLKNVRG